jgi:DNA-binding transcriptional LysR family regulator
MELAELKVFLAVASERSFSRAAAKLYKTQPAVSQAVRRLEEQLGERLFNRATKNATLTPAGDVLFREGTRPSSSRKLLRLPFDASPSASGESSGSAATNWALMQSSLQ